MVFRKGRTDLRRGSWLWTLRVAELTSWGTAAIVLIVLHSAELPRSDYISGLLLVGSLAALLAVLFRVVLPRPEWRNLGGAAAIVVTLAYAGAVFGLLRDDVPSAQLIFVPAIVGIGLLTNFPQALGASVVGVITYLSVAAGIDRVPDPSAAVLNAAIFLLSGSVAGLLARELRRHYRGEQESHRLATAVRHRLLAVVDAVDEAVIFRDRQGIVRVVNQRAGELFQIDANEYLGLPVVELLRTVARQMDDPEEFMEVFQKVRGDVTTELRERIEQIIPERRRLRMYSAPTFDDSGALIGRIDVYTDITESIRRAEEVQELYEQARKTAESYQRSLLPETLPALPRLNIVAHYLPAAGRRAVCGDFYDFIPLANGKVAVVLGDVCGVGPRAATDAALTRYTLRSFAGEEGDPAKLLERINSLIYSQTSNERFVRLLVGVLDPERAGLEYANAGHVPPVVYRSETGEVEWLAEGGIALGVDREAGYKVASTDLHPGDMLVLYTDGVTEAPRHGRPLGQGKFSDLVTEYGVGTPGELVQAIRRFVDAWVSDDLRDDLALLVCQVVPDTTLQEQSRELVLPNEPIRVSEIRAFVGSFLSDMRAPVDVSQEVLLAVGEAAANAHRHGRKPEGRSEIRVRCLLEGPRVEIAIADDGPGFDVGAAELNGLPDRFASGGRGLFLIRQLMDDVDIASSVEGTTVTMHRRVLD